MAEKPFGGDRAKLELNRCLDEDAVHYTRHFLDELAMDGLIITDVWTVCRSGVVRMAPEPDPRSGQWKYRIEGTTLHRHDIAVVFTFRQDGAVFITVFKRNP